jgi:4-hydroxythreonine-4-phosphate dehydrogenase
LTLDGAAAAVVSGPVSKQALNDAGHHFPGQTEYIAALTGTHTVLTVLACKPMRVALVSSHCSLAESIALATTSRVTETICGLDDALRSAFGYSQPRLAVAGLNPHAGDNGLLGSEELRELVPAVATARANGVDVTGPIPADTVFLQGERGEWDGIIAMYHDQAVIPLKRHHYATYAHGLPIVRTTAGHGTAYDIAGTGTADPQTMINAILVAVGIVTNCLSPAKNRS